MKKGVLLAIALLLTAPVFALSVIPSNQSPKDQLTALIDAHPVIVRGVVGQRSPAYYGRHFAFPNGDVILTNIDIAVREVLKGPISTSTLQVRSPGGCIAKDNRCFRTDIAPRLSEGDEVVLFLMSEADGTYVIKDVIAGVQIESGGVFYPLGLDFKTIETMVQQGAE